MKQVLILSSLFLSLAFVKPTQAQVSVQLNIGSQPTWGPVGYDYVDYYYLPDIEAYYYVPTRQFIYLERDQWIFSSNLPYRCRDYDLFGGYKVVINGRDPYRNHWEHRRRYTPYSYNQRQVILRDRGYDYGTNRDYGRGYNRQYRRNDFGNDYRRHHEENRDNDRSRNRDNDRYGNGNDDRRDRGKGRDKESRHERNDNNGHNKHGRGHGRRGW